jgi:protein-S-isoprenylcysteine O-methyltransferase Ste14
MWLLFRNFIYNAAALALLLWWVPHKLVVRDSEWPTPWSPQHYAAIPFFALGALLYLACLVQFVKKGGGTPLPFDPPKKVLSRGPYAWMRNPMYIAVTLMIVSEVVFFGRVGLLLYLVFLVCLFQLSVVVEEATLRRRFGALYSDYCNACPRWWPRKPRPRLETIPPFGREA